MHRLIKERRNSKVFHTVFVFMNCSDSSQEPAGQVNDSDEETESLLKKKLGFFAMDLDVRSTSGSVMSQVIFSTT